MHADLTRAVVRSSDWLRQYYQDNNSFIRPHTASSMMIPLRLSGHSADTLLSDFKNSSSFSIDETLRDYLNEQNRTHGNLINIPTGRLAYIIHGVVAICKDPEDFYGHNLSVPLLYGIKRFPIPGTFNNYFQYSLAAIAFCIRGVKVPEIMVDKLLERVNRTFKSSTHSNDINALVLIALSCVARSDKVDRAVEKLVHWFISERQNSRTGDFGNQYSTALAVQVSYNSTSNFV